MPNFPCRECDRIRKRDVEIEPKVTVSPSVSDCASGVPCVELGGKPDRLAVAAEALKRYRAKNAARQKRYRDRQKIRGGPSE